MPCKHLAVLGLGDIFKPRPISFTINDLRPEHSMYVIIMSATSPTKSFSPATGTMTSYYSMGSWGGIHFRIISHNVLKRYIYKMCLKNLITKSHLSSHSMITRAQGQGRRHHIGAYWTHGCFHGKGCVVGNSSSFFMSADLKNRAQ